MSKNARLGAALPRRDHGPRVAFTSSLPYPLGPMKLRLSRSTPALTLLACSLSMTGPAAAQESVPQIPEKYRPRGPSYEITLEWAIQLALESNLGLKVEQLATEVALYNQRGSWGSFDWNLAASAGVTDREFQSTNVFSGTMENSQDASLDVTRLLSTGGTFKAHFDTTNTKTDSTFAAQSTSTNDVVSLSFSQPLLRGAWREYTTSLQREANLDWKRQQEHEREIRSRMVLDVSNAYWDLVSAKQQLDVAESSLTLARTQVEQDQRRLDAGVGTPIDVVQAQAQVATREERRLAADVRVREAMDALKQLVFPGTDQALWETQLVPSTPLPAATSAEIAPPWSAALAVAIEHRAELRQQRLAIDASTVRRARALSEKRPGLNLDLSASGTGFDGDSSQAFQDAIQYDFPTYRAALTYNFPLSNTSARYAEKIAWANLRSARLVYDQIESRIVGEVRAAVRQVVYQSLAVSAAVKSLDLAQRQLAAQESRREVGIQTNFEVLQFQQQLAEAMSTERTARVNYAKALVALEAAQGLIGETAKR